MSNRRREGFENAIAALLAADLHRTLRYTWYPLKQGFLRKTLNAGLCDVVMGLPVGLQGVATTRPYYSSTYVFVTLRKRIPQLNGLDDPALAGLRIGLPTVGAGGINTPAAMSITARGLGANVIGYPVWGTDPGTAPQERIIRAVARGELDTAILWGPVGGYFAKHSRVPLLVTPIGGDPRAPELTFSFAIGIAVRTGEELLRAEIQSALDRHRPEINAVLESYGVPLLTDRS